MKRAVTHFAVMKVRGLGLACCLGVLFAAHGVSVARAQDKQFVLIDATFTASASNTTSSEYAVAPLPTAPANWRTPVDYASGSLHVRIRVLEKPSAMKTLSNVCLKTGDVLTCMPYPDPYTKPGVYNSEPKFSTFWQYEMFDWTKPVERVNVVVKDENGRFVQGNPAFFPTKMHVTVTVVPPGERYVDPDPTMSDDDSDAGVGMSPTTTPGGAPRNPIGSSSAGTAAPAAAGTAGIGAATAGVSGQSAPLAPPPTAGEGRSIRDFIDPGSSCAVLSARPKARYGAIVSVAFAAVFAHRMLRKARRNRREL
jgi:hypothetical protein